MKQRAILFFFIGIMTGILQAQTLTLKDAGQLFLKQNLSLIAARYDMDIAQAQVLQARLFENPVISLEQNVYNRLNGKYFDMGKDGESGVEIEQVISIAGQRSNRIRLEKVNKEMAGYQFQEIMRTSCILTVSMVTTCFKLSVRKIPPLVVSVCSAGAEQLQRRGKNKPSKKIF